MNFVLIILWCTLIFLNGMNAVSSFRNNHIGSGILYILCSYAWMACVCMKFWVMTRG